MTPALHLKLFQFPLLGSTSLGHTHVDSHIFVVDIVPPALILLV